MAFQVLITNEKGTSFFPLVEEGIQWTTDRRGSPGTLKFTVIKDTALGKLGGFGEGSSVNLMKDGKTIFFGFVFIKQRDKTNDSGLIKCTAYDQIRYLKNKDTYVYTNKTADAFIKMVAGDYGLNLGTIEATSYVIPTRTEENTALLDMIENALDLELTNQKEMFVLFDEAGKLTLKNISSMRVPLLIDAETGENYDYTSSIDEQTYNQIKLTYDNEETGKREIYIAKDSAHINQWGILQYFDTLKEGENGAAKANALLSLYNSKTRKLKITKAFGDERVRAGSLIPVSLNLGDIIANTFMLVEKAVHTFNESEHWMDLTLRGGEFIA
mgnify:FL=1